MKKRYFKTMLSIMLAVAMVVTTVPANLTLTVQAAEASVETPQDVDANTETGLENPGGGGSEVQKEGLAPEGGESGKNTTGTPEVSTPTEEPETTVDDETDGEKDTPELDNPPTVPSTKAATGAVTNGKAVTFTCDITDGKYGSGEGSKLTSAEKVEVWGEYKNTPSNWIKLATLTKDSSNETLFTGTETFSLAGRYEYKFVADDQYKVGASNEEFFVAGIVGKTIEAKAGQPAELPATLTYYADDGTTSDQAVSYELTTEANSAGVTTLEIPDGKTTVTVPTNAEVGTSYALTATNTGSSGDTATLTVKVVSILPDPSVKSPVVGPGKVTFNYYNPDSTVTEVKVAGDFTTPTWDNDNNSGMISMTYDDSTGYWSATKEGLQVGDYLYKFVVYKGTNASWITDDLNENKNGDNSAFSITEAAEGAVVGPIVKEGNIVTFLFDFSVFELESLEATATGIYVVGSMNGWQDSIGTDNEWKMTKNEESGYWEFTKQMSAGRYEYKYIVVADNKQNWTRDKFNPSNTGGGDPNSVLILAGLVDSELEVARSGDPATLPAQLALYGEDGNSTNTAVSYALSTETAAAAYKDKIELNDTDKTISLKEDFPKDVESFTLTAKATVDEKDYTSTVTVTVVDKKYKYTIYYYDDTEGHLDMTQSEPWNQAALWIWSTDVAGTLYPFTDKTKIKGVDWLKAEVETSLTELQIIPRNGAPETPWVWQDETRKYNNKNADAETELYIIWDDGHNIYTSEDQMNFTLPFAKRNVVVEYTRTSDDEFPIRSAADNAGWKIYTWNSGYGSNVYADFAKKDTSDKVGLAKVQIKRGLESLSFCMAYGSDELNKNHSETGWLSKDGGDHRVDVPANQNVVKVKMEEGKGVTYTYPYNIGYEIAAAEKTIHFYYRDDDEFLAGDTSTHTVELEIGTKNASGAFEKLSGTATMEFDSTTQRWKYDLVSTEEMSPITYYYRYKVDSDYVLDSFNTAAIEIIGSDAYSVCTYEKPEVDIKVTMQNASMDYNDNNVLSVEFVAKEGGNSGSGDSGEGGGESGGGTETGGESGGNEGGESGGTEGGGTGGGDVTTEAMAEDGAEDTADTEESPVKVAKATVDLSSVGGSAETAIDPELLKIAIAVKEGTTEGEKTLPVVVYDEYGNKYEAEAKVNVAARVKNNDFDWDEAIIYFAVTDRFFDGNASNNGIGYNVGEYGSSSYHGGDFAGLTQKLDYLDDLGVNTIWITPIVEQQTEANADDSVKESWGYHGYWAKDFEKLDSHLGTEAEFQALLDAAHARGMKIMVDVVLNHAGYGDEIKEYFNGKLGTDENGAPIRMIREDEEMITGNDQKSSLSGLQDFLTENKEVRDLLVEWQSKWISNYDIDYYRVDTVKHVDNTTWNAFKNALTQINPDFKMIGEWAGAGYATNTGTLGEGRMDSLLDFDFNNQATNFVTGNISSVEAFMTARNAAINNTEMLGAFLGSHDEDGFAYALVNDKGMSEEKAQNLAMVAASLELTAKGQVIVYYGEEIGMTGANDYPWQTNRYDFDWSLVDDSNPVLAHYKAMLEIRNRYSEVLSKGSRTTLKTDDSVDVFQRSKGDTTLTVALNISDEPKTVELTGMGAGTVLYDYYAAYKNGVRNPVTADAEGKLTITIPAAADGGTVVLTSGTPDVSTGNVQPGFDVAPIAAKAFTGKNITISEEELKVYYDGQPLEIKKDYTASYKNNKNPGTATITIKGKGNYAGSVTVDFQITKKNVADADIAVEYKDLVATGKAQKALTKITNNGTKLGTKDYTVKYYLLYANGKRAGGALTSVTAGGKYEMVITGTGNYTGTRTEKFRVIEGGTYMNKLTITLYKSGTEEKITGKGLEYTGSEIEVDVVVRAKDKNKTVVDKECYEIDYAGTNREVGTATVKIKGIPEKGYCGEVVKTFKITGVALNKVAEVDLDKWAANVTYDYVARKAVQPKEDVGLLKLKANAPAGSTLTTDDYKVDYAKYDKPGTATVTFTGRRKYTGTIKKTFKVDAIDISSIKGTADADGSVYTVASTAPYRKAGAKPEVVVTYKNNPLHENVDYKLTYKDNKAVGGSKTPSVEIKGMGVFTGKLTGTFTVAKLDLSAVPDSIPFTAPDMVYQNRAGKYMSTPVLDGTKLTSSNYTLTYSVMVDGAKETVTKDDVVSSGTVVTVEVTPKSASAMKTYEGTGTLTYRIVEADISKAKVSVKAQEYTGKEITLDKADFSSVKVGNNKLVLGRDFEIVEKSYTNNINKGNATVTIKGIGNYSGEKKVTFKITSRFMKWWWNLFA
ncbi:MAG: alpha-amylase family glycosyl hydrolase [Blautia sp.]|nr:alpha-amylase family glycosyl hydrolase [Blautia sp.]MCM1219878.1 alpha-amylase family glycosyl hydrolase [Lachnospiraceae bacterium]